ncbi:DNA primase [Actibacterium sp. XHP0104]|uniref:DNA primase n=1 Tax=Actibacterium sp. XHP0104 TaxID=2984335 RepID=UPI0021E94C43|nr:DNA primase [Actibacterium sp. XHP0104]MCV2881413.1 DNA primase [Actibacterium sp. XHP0104]
MSLPPGFLDELRTRTSLSQVVGRKVMWDQRKSNPGKGDMWAPCPFHQEKTASFHVDDRKGYYYCFGCHAKGDAISFVRETENVEFMEAIEILAGEAGMQMPARDPRAAEKADRRSQLIEVTEQAVKFFRLQLKTAAGAEARAYLQRRGLSDAALDRWEIGFAPPGWQNLWDHLTGKGVAPDLILAAGLAKPSDKGRNPYDVFRDRIMFPIRDPRGRAIAFGGRAMDPNDNAKYLNSPETDLFDKSRTLFNYGPAREAAGKGQPLIVAEGYMDVIALSEAGFGATVAGLGTAITDHHLHMLWRVAPEPIVALDGDKAGTNAAMRAMDLALPLLEAGQSLRFAIMPAGQDPDDVIRAGGAGAMQKLLDAAQPMVRLLWQRETEGRVFDSPERKAALDKDLRAALKRISDASIRGHYADEIKQLRWELFGQRKPGTRPGRRGAKADPARAMPSTKHSALVAANEAFTQELREAVILATLITHPALMEDFLGELERMECLTPDHRRIQTALLTHVGETDPERLRQAIDATLGPAPLEKLMSLSHVRIAPPMQDPANTEKAVMCLAEELAKLDAERGAAREIEEAVHDMQGLVDEGLTWRLGQVAEARHRAGRGDTEDKGEYDLAPNGARLSRDERNAFDALLTKIGFGKPGQR